jgi:hypothetical protein
LQRDEVVLKVAHTIRREPSVGEPLPDQAIDGAVVLVRVVVIALEPREQIERVSCRGIT